MNQDQLDAAIRSAGETAANIPVLLSGLTKTIELYQTQGTAFKPRLLDELGQLQMVINQVNDANRLTGTGTQINIDAFTQARTARELLGLIQAQPVPGVDDALGTTPTDVRQVPQELTPQQSEQQFPAVNQLPQTTQAPQQTNQMVEIAPGQFVNAANLSSAGQQQAQAFNPNQTALQPQPQPSGQPAPPSTYQGLSQSLDAVKQQAQSISTALQSLADKGYGDTDISQLPQDVDISQIQAINGNLSQYGVNFDPGGLYDLAQNNPLQFVNNLYTELYKNTGLADIKSQFEDYSKRIEDINNELNDKIADINDDPWLTEGVRIDRINKLKERYQGRIDSATNTAQLLQGFYDEGLQQVQFLTGQAMSVYNRQIDFQQDAYLKQMEIAARREDLLFKQQIDQENTLFEAKVKQQYPSASSGSGVSNQVIDNERALLSQFRGEPIVKNYNEILAKKLSVDAIISQGVGGPGDLALVFEFMKALDPTSVVRESEYAAAAKSGNIFLGTFARFNGYLKENGGFLPPQVRSAFQSLVNSKLQVQQTLYDNVASEYSGIASRQGLNPQNVVLNYSAPSQTTQTISKGTQTNSVYVESALSQQGINYQDVIDNTPEGKIPVITNEGGQVGYITLVEFNSNTYTAL